MAQALYRRYRPDTFEGVIGQDQVTVPLMRALDNNKLTHAYLFSGPRGCGKTSSARILARCINCVQGPTSHPCGECDSCRDLATGGPGSVDVVEIDAASHNGVDDARELREQAGFAPARDRYKIFILDEAHMVSPQGFNALLKIVEEPPEHVMFIFATTEPDKVIGTIRSRTHHYPFRLVPQEVMGPYLEEVCDKEGIETEPGVLRLAMRAGGGSVRDTLSVLDQLMVGAVDGSIHYDSATALLGFTPDVMISDAIDAIIDRDGAGLYDVVRKVTVGGYDARRFVEDLLARVRDLLVLTLGGERAESVLDDDAEEQMDDLRRQQEHLDLRTLTAMAETLDDALTHLSGTVSPRMRLELLAARLMSLRQPGALEPAVPAPAATAQQAAPSAPKNNAHGGYHGGATANGGYTSPAHTNARQNRPAHNAPQPTNATPTPEQQNTIPTSSGYPTFDHANTPAPSAPSATAAEASAPMARPHGLLPNPADADRLWDGLVNALPDDVRSYVDRTKVPRVNLTINQQMRNGRLWIKFDTPLSKYAFAIAVAQAPVDGRTSVVDILRARVRNVFGDSIQLAPTQKMADGQSAPAWNKLSEQERQDYRARISRQSVNALAAAIPGIQMGIASTTETDNTDSSSAEHSSSDEHSALSSLSSSSEDSDSAHAGADTVATATTPAIDTSDDPWAMQMSAAATAVTQFATDHTSSSQTESDSNSVAPETNASVNFSQRGAAAQVAPRTAAPLSSPASQTAVPASDDEHSAAIADDAATSRDDYDDYSMSDPTLEQSNESNLEMLKRMFDVKKVEEFAANDPHNPKNAHEHRSSGD